MGVGRGEVSVCEVGRHLRSVRVCEVGGMK